ncbi:hypothetical protein BJ170DRAFT_89123 [Xylariales sp. AK1849]|nr:hypothetical protein BJ170DRAFT_89123 [Xylariales sp. AK1849]
MSSKGLVLVTGANGYIAARTVEALLVAGYSVRGTVRSRSSAKGLLAALPDAAASGTLEIVEVPDITVPGAFDEAVRSVTAIAHLATPVSFFFTDPDYVINTAVNGVKSVLESAAKAPSVKSFVLLSSIVAVMGYDNIAGHVYTEADWNDGAAGIVAELGEKTPGPVIYSTSKTEAEREFWKFQQEKKPGFSLTAINPVFVAGPPLVLPQSPDKITESTEFIWKIFAGQDIPDNFGGFCGFVDVRDVARLVVFGIDHASEANNQRYLATGTWGSTQASADILRRAYPERQGIIKEGTPGRGYLPNWSYPGGAPEIDSSKTLKATGQGWINFEKMVLDAAKVFEAYL